MNDNRFYDEWSYFGPRDEPARPARKCPKCGRPAPYMTPIEMACASCLMAEMASYSFGADFANGAASTASKQWTAEEVLEQMRAAEAFMNVGREAERIKRAREQEEAWRRARERINEDFFQRQQRSAAPQPPRPSIDLDIPMLRRLLQLCHPDKHANSESSQIATRYLLGLKDAIERGSR